MTQIITSHHSESDKSPEAVREAAFREVGLNIMNSFAIFKTRADEGDKKAQNYVTEERVEQVEALRRVLEGGRNTDDVRVSREVFTAYIGTRFKNRQELETKLAREKAESLEPRGLQEKSNEEKRLYERAVSGRTYLANLAKKVAGSQISEPANVPKPLSSVVTEAKEPVSAAAVILKEKPSVDERFKKFFGVAQSILRDLDSRSDAAPDRKTAGVIYPSDYAPQIEALRALLGYDKRYEIGRTGRRIISTTKKVEPALDLETLDLAHRLMNAYIDEQEKALSASPAKEVRLEELRVAKDVLYEVLHKFRARQEKPEQKLAAKEEPDPYADYEPPQPKSVGDGGETEDGDDLTAFTEVEGPVRRGGGSGKRKSKGGGWDAADSALYKNPKDRGRYPRRSRGSLDLIDKLE